MEVLQIREETIQRLMRWQRDRTWLEQFKTDDLQEMLQKILTVNARDIKELTQEKILEDIKPFMNEWISECDWWYGSSASFGNAPLGYDVNVAHNEDTNQIEAIIYALKPSKDDIGQLEANSEALFKFNIELEYPIYEQGEILTCIYVEEGSPYRVGMNYLVTQVDDRKKEPNNLKVYTLNDNIDFKYTNHEIPAYFKKAIL